MHTNYFAEQGSDYSQVRPAYPAALFTFLADHCERRMVAWDCATGTGQAAVPLATHFDQVIATDISEAQIRNARTRGNVSYHVGAAETYPLASHSVDLIVAAQAASWLDLPRFFQHCREIAARGGVLAFFGFREVSVNSSVDAVLKSYFDIVGPYWPPSSRQLNDSRYECIEAPFEEITAQTFEIRLHWNMKRVLNLLDSYSGPRAYLKAKGQLPSQCIEGDLRAAWGGQDTERDVVIPMFLRLWRVNS